MFLLAVSIVQSALSHRVLRGHARCQEVTARGKHDILQVPVSVRHAVVWKAMLTGVPTWPPEGAVGVGHSGRRALGSPRPRGAGHSVCAEVEWMLSDLVTVKERADMDTE